MSTAGQANEAGSVARREAAVYFAVHLLTGAAVGALRNATAITRIQFESADPTDDIVLTFADGSRAYVSVKRKIEKGKSFDETVVGWVKQVDRNLEPHDMLLLVCAETVNWVRDLAKALTVSRTGVTPDGPRARALENLRARVPTDKQNEVVQRAHILELPRTSTNADGTSMLTTMMNSVVVHRSSAAAVSRLADLVHDAASRRLAINAADLVRDLQATGIVFREDPYGPPAAKEAVQLRAFERYLASLAKTIGRVDLTLLSDDLQPFTVPSLLGNIKVQFVGEERSFDRDLTDVVRRLRRMVLIGTPGSGKSVAMRELAGWCATNSDAPTPVPVRLPELLPRQPEHDVTIDDLVDLATKRVPQGDRPHVHTVLRTSIEAGDAILILDGLDECRDRAPWIAGQVRALLGTVHADVAVVLATRASRTLQAATLGLPMLNLSRPADLNHTLDRVLTQCAQVRTALDSHDDWLQSRRTWLKQVAKEQPDILHVPQLALLVALILCSSSNVQVPRERAELLNQAVKRSAGPDELQRFTGKRSQAWLQDLSPEMLLAGFACLGRLLDNQATATTKAQALNELTDLIGSEWELTRRKASNLATEVLTFWDTHVAVFPLDEADNLTTRSRVFTEVAAAIWTQTCTAEELNGWVIKAVDVYEAQGSLSLAISLNPRVVDLLLNLGEFTPQAPIALASAVTSDSVTLGHEDLARLLDQLIRHARDVQGGKQILPDFTTHRTGRLAELLVSRRYRGGPPSWPLVESLVSLKLSGTLVLARREALQAMALPSPYSDIVKAHLSMRDALDSDRPLIETELASVHAVLRLELPKTGQFVKAGPRRYNFSDFESLPAGAGTVALLAIRFLDQLPADAPRRIYDTAEHTSHQIHDLIQSDLREAGIDTRPWRKPGPLDRVSQLLTDRDQVPQLLADISTIGDSQRTLTKHERWSYPDLAALIDATEYHDISSGEFNAAFDHDTPEERRPWLRALAHAYDIDGDAAAAQAQHILSTAAEDEKNLPAEWWVPSTSHPQRRDRRVTGPVTVDDQQALLVAMHASSEWLAWPALWVLVHSEPAWDTVAFFNVRRTGWPPFRSSNCALVALLKTDQPTLLAATALRDPDPARRHALRTAIEHRPALDPAGDYVEALANDPDLWVRGALKTGKDATEYWTCRWCGQANSLDVPARTSNCSNCELSARPDPEND